MDNNTKINEKKNSLLRYAMHYGLFLGAFWAVKYLVFIASSTIWIHFIYLYYLMNVGTFLIVYILYVKFINEDVSKVNNQLRGFFFVVLLCFFASFLESAMIYTHFQILDPSYYATKIEPNLVKMIESFPYPPEVKASALGLAGNSILYVISTFTGNAFLGLVLGGVMALLVKKNKI